MNIPGAKKLIAVGDTDGLIAVLSSEDVNHDRAVAVALTFFDPTGSKKNTLFDALVAATAKKLNAKVIFSTDNWYTKLGFKLASEL